MIKESTVFILGAGASKPYGFPTGEELRKEIIEQYVNDFRTYCENIPYLRESPLLPQELSRASEFVNAFEKSTVSIDLFLATHPQFKEDGKRAIIFRIMKAERNSTFREKMKNKKQDWLSYLFKKMTEGLYNAEDYKKFRKNKVSFITFNYDRSLEHFLYESITHFFENVPNDKLFKEFENIEFIHVFGKVSDLDWQNKESGIEYRSDITSVNIQNLIKNIKTMHEEHGNTTLEDAMEMVEDAKRIFFLGFGYAQENMDILEIPQNINVYTKVYGTMLDFIEEEIERKRNYFIAKTKSDPLVLKNSARFKEGFINTDCVGLLRKFLDDY